MMTAPLYLHADKSVLWVSLLPLLAGWTEHLQPLDSGVEEAEPVDVLDIFSLSSGVAEHFQDIVEQEEV